MAKDSTEFAAAAVTLTEGWTLLEQGKRTTGREAKACAQAFVELFTAWAKVDADAGHGAKAAEWQAKLAAMGG